MSSSFAKGTGGFSCHHTKFHIASLYNHNRTLYDKEGHLDAPLELITLAT